MRAWCQMTELHKCIKPELQPKRVECPPVPAPVVLATAAVFLPGHAFARYLRSSVGIASPQ
jgi:hypothetical protein